MFKYLALVATVIASDASFCGCGVCSIYWKAGSATQQAILLGLSCSNFQQLASQGSVPPINLSDGEACTDVLADMIGSQVMGKTTSDFIGPNSTCPSGAAINLNSADPEEMIALAEELEEAWTQ